MGIVKEALKNPELFVATLGGFIVIRDEPANVTIIGWEAPKPEPVIFTDEPTGPLVGLKVIEGMTVKLA